MKSFADCLAEMQASTEEDPIKMMIEVLAHAVMEAGVTQHLSAAWASAFGAFSWWMPAT